MTVMCVTRAIALAASLLLFGIHLLSTLLNPHRIQDKYIDVGLNITLASKQIIQVGREEVNRSRRELVRSAIFTPPLKNTSFLLLLVSLLLGGNIESNPSPQYIYPCGECSKPVKRNQNRIQCDMCDIWFHAKCNDIDLQMLSFSPIHRLHTSNA